MILHSPRFYSGLLVSSLEIVLPFPENTVILNLNFLWVSLGFSPWEKNHPASLKIKSFTVLDSCGHYRIKSFLRFSVAMLFNKKTGKYPLRIPQESFLCMKRFCEEHLLRTLSSWRIFADWRGWKWETVLFLTLSSPSSLIFPLNCSWKLDRFFEAHFYPYTLIKETSWYSLSILLGTL